MAGVRVKGGHLPEGALRLLDANLNRAREALRVLEDTARFLWRKERLFKSFRRARHALDRRARAHYFRLLSHRAAAQDEGRKVREGGRADAAAVAAANFRRVQEALRVLEEYGKILSAQAGREFKSLRFRLYGLEKSAMQEGRKS